METIAVLILFLIVRITSVFVVQTFYVPDEYWQSLEVAHKLAFGYGYLTWEWIHGLRSYIYPLFIAGIYKTLQVANMDSLGILILAPRIFQALISAYADYRFYVWSGKKKWAIFIILVSFFWFYTASRTLANTFETALTTISLSYFPWHRTDGTGYLWLAAICCFVRPTAAIIWIPLCLHHLFKSQYSAMGIIIKKLLPIGLLVGGCGMAIDSYIFGKFIFTPWEFLKYNFFHNIGSFYGVHPWYWYFLVGLPTILGINFVPFLIGVIATIRNSEVFPIRKQLLLTIVTALIAYSCIAHKEFRFILILLPMCLYICADTLSRWSYKASKYKLWIVALIILVGNIIPAWYLSLVHQRGTLDVMHQLADIAENYRDEDNKQANILFLMPCHSTPYYSHIHQNISMRFLTCHPNIENKDDYIDEADDFYKVPDKWLRSHLPSYPRTAMPTHLVLFEQLSEKITEFLNQYQIINTIFYAEYFTERTGRHILIYERTKPEIEQNIFNPHWQQDELSQH